MGQQQLLLIILGVIIVGIAITVGISLFNSSAVDNNRDSIKDDLLMIAIKAQEFYMFPKSLGGGGKSFVGLTANTAGLVKLVSTQYSNNDQAAYRISTAGTANSVVITAVGKTKLPNGTYPTYTCRVRARNYTITQTN